METIQNKRLHSISVENRESTTMRGIEKVTSYSSEEICVTSSCGKITVLGKDLKIEKFDDAEGFLSFLGTVDCIRYSTSKPPLLKRLFK